MKFIKIKLNYISNFSPNFKKHLVNKNKKIFIKNILIFIYILQLRKVNLKVSIFIKPIIKKNFLILRAPYRYKLGRLNIGIIRYSTDIVMHIPITNKKVNTILLEKNMYKELPLILESSMLHLNRFTIISPIILKNNFLINNF